MTLPLSHNDHHEGRIRLVIDGHTPRETTGATTWWDNGLTSYVLHFRSGNVHGWTMADEADTAIRAVETLREGEELSEDALYAALRDSRRLSTRLAALQDELVLYAREAGPNGKPRMAFRELSDALNLHLTTIRERHGRVAGGSFAAWRNWLVQGTDRVHMYPTPTGGPARRETLREQAQTRTAALLAEATDLGADGFRITVTDYTTGRDVLETIDLPEWENFRAASAGHRLIERGFAVLPAAHMEATRFAGWTPDLSAADPTTTGSAPRATVYTAPVYRLDPDASRVPVEHDTEVYDVVGQTGMVFAQCGTCEWETEPMSNVITAARLGGQHQESPGSHALRTRGPATRPTA